MVDLPDPPPLRRRRNTWGWVLAWLHEQFDADKDAHCITVPGRALGYTNIEIEGQAIRAHVVVCTWQNGPQPEGMEASHTCGNGSLGCVNRRHLIWETHAQNMARQVREGLVASGVEAPRAKLLADEVLEIRQRLAAGEPQRLIAVDYCVSQGTISNIALGKTYREV